MVPVVRVVGGHDHSTALDDEGAIWSWGDNRFGQLGDGTFEPRAGPIRAEGLTGVLDFGATDHTCAIEPSGCLLCWGRNDFGQVGDGTFDHRNLPGVVILD